MRRSPVDVDRIAVELAAYRIVDTTRRDAIECRQGRFKRQIIPSVPSVIKQEQNVTLLRDLGCLIEAAFAGICVVDDVERSYCRDVRPDFSSLCSGGSHAVNRIRHLVGNTQDLPPLFASPCGADSAQSLNELRFRKIRAGEKRLGFGLLPN